MTNFQLLTSSLAFLAFPAFLPAQDTGSACTFESNKPLRTHESPGGAYVCTSDHRLTWVPDPQLSQQTRILANLDVGTASGLGYKLPHILAGVSLEKPVGMRWEAQGALSYSPDRKYITNDGNAVQAGATALFWPIQRVAVTGELDYGHLWTHEFQKSAWWPAAGVVIRDSWYGAPGRFYVAYVFPAGCQWGKACVIQSSRTHGIQGLQEFRLASHWRIGLRAAWWRFAEQSNPLYPSLGRVWHNTGEMSFVVRYEFRAGSLVEKY